MCFHCARGVGRGARQMFGVEAKIPPEPAFFLVFMAQDHHSATQVGLSLKLVEVQFPAEVYGTAQKGSAEHQLLPPIFLVVPQ